MPNDDKPAAKPALRRFSLFAKPMGDALIPLVKQVYKKHGFAEHRILTEWNAIAGHELSAYSMPQKLSGNRGRKEGGTLHILVAAARALELQHMQPVILSRIAAYFGYEAVAKLVFIQSHSAMFQKTIKRSERIKALPSPELLALMEQCRDEKLQGALISLATALSAVEK